MARHNMTANDRKYEIEAAARALIHAEEIKADKKLLAAARKEAAKQAKAAARAAKVALRVSGEKAL